MGGYYSTPAPTTLHAAQGTQGTQGTKPCEEGMVCSEPDLDPTTGKEVHTAGGKTPYAYMHSGCPLNRRELGRASWAFLHTLAAYYPTEPTTKDQERMRDFILKFAAVYPCGYCADTTSEEMVRHPPRVESRHEFQQYMCEIHNEVNDRLGKPQFDCSKLNERWREGPTDGSCS